ncbi:MAG: alpha/beta hydrolase [Alphaproteobacteria bacterium]|nr:alpha/beta hydrolase [Alphaproteobacteria bacterium]
MRPAAALSLCLIALAACGEPAPQSKQNAAPPPPAKWTTPVWETVLPTPPLPKFDAQGTVAHDGAKIWYATIGQGTPVILLHGAFGSAENFGFQVPALLKAGYRVILIETRGHARSTRDPNRPLSYEVFASDVVAVMDALRLPKASVVGWSDGAIQGLILAMRHPKRLDRVFAFGANMDQNGIIPGITERPIFIDFMERAPKDYARLSPPPHDFKGLYDAMYLMLTTEPNYTEFDLSKISGPKIAVVDGDKEEIIKPQHTSYLGKAIPRAKLIVLPGVSHFAPMQKPEEFNAAMLAFLSER